MVSRVVGPQYEYWVCNSKWNGVLPEPEVLIQDQVVWMFFEFVEFIEDLHCLLAWSQCCS